MYSNILAVLSFCCLLVTGLPGNLKSNIELVSPPCPTSNQLVSLHFVDATTGWAVGEYGTILKSTDAGENWRLIEIPQLNYLTDVYFPTAATGYIVGKDGMILKSIDGGESWFPQTIRFTNNLHQVRFRDENTGWVIGEKGLILHTRDGGGTWVQQFSNSRENLNGMHLLESNNVCVVGNDSTILMSSDSGKVWQRISYQTQAFGEYRFEFNDVFFLDSRQGWIGGTGFYEGLTFEILLHTTDGGNTWIKTNIENLNYTDFVFGSHGSGRLPAGLQQVFFFNSTQGLFLTDIVTSGNIFFLISNLPFATNDGSKNWYSRLYGSMESFPPPGRFAVLSPDRIINTGFRGEFRISTDGGLNWRYSNQNERCWEFLVIGNQGTILGKQQNWEEESQQDVYIWKKSENHGRTWKTIQPRFYDASGTFQSNVSLFYPGNYIDQQKLILTIANNAVYKSNDGGENWNLVRSPVLFRFYQPAFFLSADTIIRYGMQMRETSPGKYQPELYFNTSIDGGTSENQYRFTEIWNEIIPYQKGHSPKFISKHYFFNGHTGFLIGSEGNIIKTTNTGQSWENIPSGVVEDLWDITFVNRQTGFVVGNFGRILKTTDGGRTWRKTDSGTQEAVYSIGFKNETEGWAGTETGLHFTPDGGETWQGVPLRYFHGPVREIEFDQDGTGYAYTYKFYSYESTNNWNSRPGGYFLLLVLKEGGVVIENAPAAAPYQFTLSQNYPNPFNSTTHIRFSLPENAAVSLKIYNIQGQLVRTLLDEVRKPGEHSVAWNGTSNSGQLVASGVYFLRLIQGEQVRVRKLLVLK